MRENLDIGENVCWHNLYLTYIKHIKSNDNNKMHKIVYKLWALKQLRKLRDSEYIVNKINELTDMPNCINVKSLTHYKYDSRLRIGNYRVFFNFDGFIKIVSIKEVKKRDDNTY